MNVALLGLSETAIRTVDSIGVWVAAILTLAIFSFLYKDNPLYKAAEHLMVGLAMGYFAIVYVINPFEIQWWNRFVEGDLKSGDKLFGSQDLFRWSLVVPAVFGLLMWARVVPKIAWVSRWCIALLVGITSGLVIPWVLQARVTTHLEIATRLPIDYMEALAGGNAGFTETTLWQLGVPILVLGTVCALIYFFFSIPHRGAVGQMATAGIWIMMIGFGASFGYTVMARVSLLIGRVSFLLSQWLGLIST